MALSGVPSGGRVSAAGISQPETSRVRRRSRQAPGSSSVEVIGPSSRPGHRGPARYTLGIGEDQGGNRLATTPRLAYSCGEPTLRTQLPDSLETMRAAL